MYLSFSQSNQPDTSAPSIGWAEWTSAGDSIWAGRLQQRPPRQQPFELGDCMLTHAIGRKQICSFWGLLQVCILPKRWKVSKGHFYLRTRVWYIMIQVIFAAGYIWQKKGRITWLLFWLSSNSSSPYILTYSLYEQKIVICTISCLKRCFIVHIPLDVAIAQNEAPIRSLNSGHNRKNAAIPNVLLLVEPLVLLFILFFLFSFLCPVFTAAEFQHIYFVPWCQ